MLASGRSDRSLVLLFSSLTYILLANLLEWRERERNVGCSLQPCTILASITYVFDGESDLDNTRHGS